MLGLLFYLSPRAKVEREEVSSLASVAASGPESAACRPTRQSPPAGANSLNQGRPGEDSGSHHPGKCFQGDSCLEAIVATTAFSRRNGQTGEKEGKPGTG